MSATAVRTREFDADAARARITVSGWAKTADYYGISRTTLVRRLNPASAERMRKSSREAKRRRTGSCVDCGATTRYNGHGIGVSERCPPCAAILNGIQQTHWTPELVIERIQEWAQLYGEPPAATDWNPNRARQINDEARALRFEEAAGHWPWVPDVCRIFRERGSWNGAIEEAGFAPRCAHGGCGNSERLRHQSEPEVRLRTRAHAVAHLVADRVSTHAIARFVYEQWGYASMNSCRVSLRLHLPAVGRGRKLTAAEKTVLRQIP